MMETHRIQVAMKAWKIERPLYSLSSLNFLHLAVGKQKTTLEGAHN